MGAKSKIEWTDASWNPIRAINRETGALGWYCEHASPGCVNCYAETFNGRMGCKLKFIAQNRDKAFTFVDHGELEIYDGDRLLLKRAKAQDALRATSRWTRPRKIFVCSMTDLFGEWVTDAMIDEVMVEIITNPRHVYQVVTKRAARMRRYFEDLPKRIADWDCHAGLDYTTHLPENLWLLVSAEDQRRWDERVDHLLNIPAAVRGVSVEPLIGWISPTYEQMRLLDWIIVGGESGHGARALHPSWARDFRDLCKESRTAFFFKQWGEWAPHDAMRVPQMMQEPGWPTMYRTGKKFAGRTLDGSEYSEFPKPRADRLAA